MARSNRKRWKNTQRKWELLDNDLKVSFSITPSCVLWTQSQRLHSAHTFLAGSREGLFLDILQVPLGYIWSPPLPNFNPLIFHINLKCTKRLESQNIHSNHMQVLWLFYDSIFKALVLCLNLLIHILCLSIVLYCAYFSSCLLWLFMVSFKLLRNYLNFP